MKEQSNRRYGGLTDEGPIEQRFHDFQELIDKFGLSTFVAFVMHKHFDHTDISALTASDKELLIAECQPLLQEAICEERTLQ